MNTDLDDIARSGFVVINPSLADRLAAATRWLQEAECAQEAEDAAAEIYAAWCAVDDEARREYADEQFSRDA
jgi:hypothetical protein